MSENINDLCGNLNVLEGDLYPYPGRPIAGYHMVKYGETQEYLESLAEEGYMLMYSEDNPPEEGKLTVAKPNAMPEYLKDYATNVVYDEYGNFISCSVEGLFTLAEDSSVAQTTANNVTLQPTDLCGPFHFTPQIDPEYAKQLEEQLKNVKMRQAGYGRGQAFFKFIYDSDEAETPSGYELVRTETWSGPDCTDEQIADIARYIISNDFYDEQQKALMLEAVDAFLAKEEKITVADGTPNYTPVATFSQITALDEKETNTTDTTDTDTTDNIYADPGLCGPQPISWSINPEKLEEMKNVKCRLAGFGEGPVHFQLFYDSVESDTPSRFELVRIGDSDWTNEQIASHATSMIEKGNWDDQQRALMREAVEAFRANPKMAQSYYEYQRSLTIISTMDAETEAVTSVQVACAEDDGWRTVGVLNNPDGIDWKYQAGNLTGSGAASVVWHAQELGALGVWTDGTDNWTGIAGWFDENWTMLGCGDFDGDGKDSVLMSLNGGLFYSVDLDGTLTSLGGLNWSGWEFGAIGDFAGDGKDDIVLFHKELGCVVLLADGNADDYTSIGQLDGSDWNIAGAGDFDGDGKDDLLVRQTSTGLAGAYAGGDMNRWSVVDTASEYYLA